MDARLVRRKSRSARNLTINWHEWQTHTRARTWHYRKATDASTRTRTQAHTQYTHIHTPSRHSSYAHTTRMFLSICMYNLETGSRIRWHDSRCPIVVVQQRRRRLDPTNDSQIRFFPWSRKIRIFLGLSRSKKRHRTTWSRRTTYDILYHDHSFYR